MEITNTYTGNKKMATKSLKDQYGNAIYLGNEVSFKYGTEHYSDVLDFNIETGEILVVVEIHGGTCNLWIDADRCTRITLWVN